MTSEPATAPAAPARQETSEPFLWVTFLVLGLVILAIAAVIGGFVEAGNHAHVVVSHDVFGSAHRDQAKDWNYLYAGVGSAISLIVVAGVVALLRAIAVDVRRLADR